MSCEKCGRAAHKTKCQKPNPGKKICMDCCIRDGGHKCQWFALCWGLSNRSY